MKIRFGSNEFTTDAWVTRGYVPGKGRDFMFAIFASSGAQPYYKGSTHPDEEHRAELIERDNDKHKTILSVSPGVGDEGGNVCVETKAGDDHEPNHERARGNGVCFYFLSRYSGDHVGGTEPGCEPDAQ